MTDIPFRRDDPLPPGQVQHLAPALRRILCDNPGPFTSRGTNAWIIGPPGGDVAILDPGPAHPAHRDALLRATAADRVTAVLVSHTHRDHSPGAAPLARALNVPTLAFSPHLTPPEDGGEGADHAFTPDRRMPDGAVIDAATWRLTALHTPGHCANHLCFAAEGDGIPPGTLLSADHVMSWSTSIVSPPDGDMAAYLRSLDRVIALAPSLLLPGHGAAHDDPAPFLAALRTHRLAREAAILDALRTATRDGGGATAADLVPVVYGPTLDPRLAPAAARSLLAHLLKSAADGTSTREGDTFRIT
ncbi:MBL fold metallo-hydrolase [Roseomonas sp. CCTCC AB2023176]|uniref:MBL fold metallo-hydrolase n=1 Tax=Roseomonas sp. CCTCC AB2023176 TaxID=3342640 RepID=UPI0035DAB32E